MDTEDSRTIAAEQGRSWVDPTTERLREELETAQASRWQDGAVIRFRWERYNYAAIYVRATDRWYVTGLTDKSTIPRGINGDLLVETLLDRQCTDIAVATGWETV